MDWFANGIDSAVTWLGERSERETWLLRATWVLVLLYALGSQYALPAYRALTQERIRHRASEVSLAKLESLLEHRDEIMNRATGLMDDYAQSHELEASTLILQRIDRTRDSKAELTSISVVSNVFSMT